MSECSSAAALRAGSPEEHQPHGRWRERKSFMSSINIERQTRSPDSSLDLPSVAILLTTYNGSKFLKEQLQSIIEQTHTRWTLYVSDDGSSDGTLQIIKSYQAMLGRERIRLFHGPKRGFAQNFLSLIRNPDVCGDYFAFSDQDDIWFPDKLERSLAQIPQVESGPALYCSRTSLIDETGDFIGYSPQFSRAPSFQNALVQSLAGANTMLLNRSARELLARIPRTASIVSHDWLCYLLVSGCGGLVCFDAEPTLDYRQHSDNLMGANSSWRGRLMRMRMMFGGTFREWNQKNIAALRNCTELLDERSQAALDLFERARNENLLRRFYFLKKAGVYRQTGFGTIGLIIATGIGRI